MIYMDITFEKEVFLRRTEITSHESLGKISSLDKKRQLKKLVSFVISSIATNTEKKIDGHEPKVLYSNFRVIRKRSGLSCSYEVNV